MFDIIEILDNILNINNPYVHYDPNYDYIEADGENFKKSPFDWFFETPFGERVEEYIEDMRQNRQDKDESHAGEMSSKKVSFSFLSDPIKSPAPDFINNEMEAPKKEGRLAPINKNFDDNFYPMINFIKNEEAKNKEIVSQKEAKETGQILKILEKKEVIEKIKEIQAANNGSKNEVNVNYLNGPSASMGGVEKISLEDFGPDFAKALNDASKNKTVLKGY